VSAPIDKVCDDFLALARWGLTSTPDKDFVSRGTAFEFKAWMGVSPWSEPLTGDNPPPEEQILIYYDRVAGIWAVAA
jgi:hypothetical protein